MMPCLLVSVAVSLRQPGTTAPVGALGQPETSAPGASLGQPETTAPAAEAGPAPSPAPTQSDRWLLMKSLQGTWQGWLLDSHRMQITGWTVLSVTASSAER